MTETGNPTTALRSLIDHTPACNTDPYREDDAHDLALADLRDILCGGGDFDLDDPQSTVSHELITIVRAMRDTDRDGLSALALELSVCPIHFVDYAICFDDDNPECYPVRMAFPSHDV